MVIASRRPLSEYAAPLDDSTVISIERGTCFGWCPDYKLRLFGSGRVEFEGKHFVCDFGRREAPVDTREVRRLVEAMVAGGFLAMNGRVGYPFVDGPSVVTSLHHEGHTSRVSNLHEGSGAPRWASSLPDEIDRVAGTARWLPSLGDDWHLYCKAPDGRLQPLTMHGAEHRDDG